MNWLSILGNTIGGILGISKTQREAKAKLKELELQHKIATQEALTKAQVDRIMSNTDSDNQIDFITAQNKKYTLKDEVVTYLFLVPVVVATLVPFITAYTTNEWVDLNKYVLNSYDALDKLPNWYRYVLGAVVIDVLGFRSFARKLVDRYINK